MSDTYTDNEIAEEVDDTPNWVKEGTEEDDFEAEGEDISKAQQMMPSDVIEPVNNVELTIKKLDLDKYVPEERHGGKPDTNGELAWKTASMKPWLVIGPKGIDGKGKYAGKHFFPRIGFAVNRKVYDFSLNAEGEETDYYEPQGNYFGDYKAFLQSLGIKTDPAPNNNAAFRRSLVGRSVWVNIKKDRKRVKNKATGKYERVDEYENVLEYIPAKKQATKAVEQAEAAAS